MRSILMSMLIGLGSLAAATVQAGEGRLEINQACIATGCVPGDAGGFPVQTQAGAAYVLTSDLSVPSAATTAILLADRATLDLGGFTIQGVTTCTGSPAACTDTGAGDGILGYGSNAVRNGTIRGMGRYGIVSYSMDLQNVVIEQSGSDGVHIGSGPGSTVRDCRFQSNGGMGITTAFGAGARGTLVSNSVVQGNGGYGIQGGRMSLIGNIVSDNGQQGLSLSYGTTGLAQNVVIGNNGGDANPQISGSSYVQMGSNVCGTDTTCP